MIAKCFLFLLLVIYKTKSDSTTKHSSNSKYPSCDNKILFVFDDDASLKMDPVVFQKQLDFLANYTFEKWNNFDHLALTENSKSLALQFGYFKSKDGVKEYIKNSKQNAKPDYDSCYNLVSRGNSVLFVPLSDKVNSTVLNHYFRQAKIVEWNITDSETPDDWETQFDEFYGCKAATITTTENSINLYPPCYTTFTIAFDNSNVLSEEEYQLEKDFLINYVFKEWNQFDQLTLYSFADHVYSNIMSFENTAELNEFIQTEEQSNDDPNFCNVFYYGFDMFAEPEGFVVIFLSSFNETDFFKKTGKWESNACQDFVNKFSAYPLTFVLLNNKLDTNVLRMHIPWAQFIRLNLLDKQVPKNWEWQFLTAYGCNQDDYNDQSAYPCNNKFIFGYEVSSEVNEQALNAQRQFLIENVFTDSWNVFKNLALIAYSNETIIQDFGTLSSLNDIHSFIDNSTEQQNASRTSLCSVFKQLTTMYLQEVNIVLFVDEFHEQIGRDECSIWMKQVRENSNFINFVLLNKQVDTDYLLLHFPQAKFTLWNIKTRSMPSNWDLASVGCQNFIVTSKKYPCFYGSNLNFVIYDRSHYLSPFAYQRLQYFLLKNVFIQQWTGYINIYVYPNDDHFGSGSRVQMNLFIYSNLRINKEPLICSTLKTVGEIGFTTNLLFFVSKFDKDVLASDDNCNDAIKKINTLSKVTFIKLGRLVNETFLLLTFPTATIIEWNIETAKEPLRWNQMLWTAFGCVGDSPIVFPTNGKSTFLPSASITTTSLITTPRIDSTALVSTMQSTKVESTKITVASTHSTTTKSSPAAFVIVISTLVPLFVVCLIGGISGFCWYRRRKRDQIIDNMAFAGAMNKLNNEYSRRNNHRTEQEDLWEVEAVNVELFIDHQLGSGVSANVYLGRLFGDAGIKRVYPNIIALSSFTDCEVAIKVLPAYATELNKEDFKQEINFMKKLKYHAHIICFLGYTANGKILLEYCGNGDLMRFLKRNKDQFETEEGLKLKDLFGFAWQIANGMEYFSSLELVHRDLAARNVLLNSALVCKISDFGLARTDDVNTYTSKRRMPVRWLPPEALKSFEYSTKTDVWSYGVLLYEVFTLGEFPYADLDNEEILSHIESGNRLEQPEHASDDIYNLMLNCWSPTPERPTFTEICQKLIPSLEMFNINYNYISPVETTTNEINLSNIFEIESEQVAV